MVKLGASDWDLGMYMAAKGGHMNLVKYFMERGATGSEDFKMRWRV